MASKQIVWNTKMVENAIEKLNQGFILKGFENPFFEGEVGLRKPGIVFSITKDEYEEYIKCKMDVMYFAEKYCYIKGEDGKPKIITLRPYQKEVLKNFASFRFNILMSSRQSGKALKNDAIVWSESGKKKISELNPGDHIYGDDGELTQVTGVYPQGTKELYRVHFFDGTWVDCCGEHLWSVETSDGTQKIVTINSIKDNYLSKRGDFRYYVKMNKCVNYPERNLPIDPYLIGLLIGDGGLKTSTIISTKDSEIIDYCRDISIKYNCKLTYISKYDWRFTSNNTQYNELKRIIKNIGLNVGSSEKFIPEIYLIASKEQRIQILRGLMDSDGTCDKKGLCEFSTVSKELMENFRELCHSLGIRTTIRSRTASYTYNGEKRKGKISYRIKLFYKEDMQVFNLERKQVMVKYNKKFDWSKKRGISNIEPIGSDHCTCISIDNESKLFLTNNYIPTHNTICASISLLHFMLFNNSKNVLLTANKLETVTEVLDKIKQIYQMLPFFVQQGIIVWNQRSITLDNKSRAKTSASTKSAAIGNAIDYWYADEFAFIQDKIAEKFYKSVFPTISSMNNSKITITSTPNGMNLFHKLLTEAELPEGDPNKNNFHPGRVYWHEVPNRSVTYIRLSPSICKDLSIEPNDVLEYLQSKWINNKIELVYSEEIRKYVINVYTRMIEKDKPTIELDCQEEDIITEEFNGVKFVEFAEITTWKKETIKDIGGEDSFSQEYDLKFSQASRSLLNEYTVGYLLAGKKEYEWMQIDEFDSKLKWSYKNLEWVKDDDIFIPLNRKKYRIVISVDISEGLGQDYSIINIFKISPKSMELIEGQKSTYKNISDFFFLEQIGFFRSNIISTEQLAELLYLLAFEYFNEENVKIVLEYNTFGSDVLGKMANCFNGNNNFGSYVFLKYKHRADAEEEKIGLKITSNKNLLVRSFQDHMYAYNISITNPTCVLEATSFVKMTTSSGNIVYKGDSGHDDSIMTCIEAATYIEKHSYSETCYEILAECPINYSTYVKEVLNQVDYSESADYSSLINITKQRKFMSQYKNKKW